MDFSKWCALIAAGSVALAGCGGRQEQPLPAEAFFRHRPLSAEQVSHPADQSGALQADEQAASTGGVPAGTSDGAPPPPAVADMPPLVQEMVQPVPSGATSQPALEPGQFMVLGFVVAQINATPIYANNVLNSLRSALMAEAKRLDERRFRAVATELIAKRVRELVVVELEVAAAQGQLETKEKDLAQLLTMDWKKRQITAAGGSLEVAKQNAAREGQDFDQLVNDEYRANLTKVFYRKKIVPLIQVSADEMRQYYLRNVEKEFTQRGQATFQLLRIIPKGDKAAAETLANELRARAAGGATFDELAGSNSAAATLRNMGTVGPIDQNAYRLEEVEKQVWQTKPGEITPVISEAGDFYIARVEAIKAGNLQAFESVQVQDAIYNTLWRQQFAQRREAEQEKLLNAAILTGGQERDINTVVDMAMQNYRHWASAE